MGSIKSGIMGGFSGKVGNIVGSHWLGIDYMKALPRKSSKLATQLQIDVRTKFNMVIQFLKPVAGLIDRGYKSVVNKKPMNAAVQYTLDNAVTGVSPDFEIDYAKLRFTKGSLDRPVDCILSALEPLVIEVSWSLGDDQSGKWKRNDQATLLVYNPSKDRFVVKNLIAVRDALTAKVTVPLAFVGDLVHCYLNFVSFDKKIISNTVYCGQINVL